MAETIDQREAVADLYAQALFELALEADRVEAVRDELTELTTVYEMVPEAKAFVASEALDDDVRAAALERIFRGRISDMVLNTLQVMNANGRHGLIASLRDRFILRQETALNQVKTACRSAVELDAAQQKAVTETAARLSGKKPVMSFRVEPELLGGLVLEIGDLRFDNSLRSQLAEARQRLLERSERGLAVPVEE